MNDNNNNNNQNENKPQGLSDYVGNFRQDTHYSQNNNNQGNIYLNPSSNQPNKPLFVAEGAPIKATSHRGKVLFLLLLLAVGVAAYFLSPSQNKGKNENKTGNVIQAEEMDAYDYEIAKVLFKAHFGTEFQENRIKSAKYNHEQQIFSTEYVSIIRNGSENDSVIFTTNDFVSYQIEEKKYNEETKEFESNNYTYYNIPNSKINEIRNIAIQKEYNVSGNLTDKEYQELFKIYTESDFGHLTELITSGEFELDTYNHIKSSNKIMYRFPHVTEEEAYITLECYMGFDNYCEYKASSPFPDLIITESSTSQVHFDQEKEVFTISYSYTLRSSLITRAKEYTDKIFN